MTLPLADVRILAVEQFGAGPWGTLQLADLAGVSKSYLSYIERNVQNNPSLQVLAKIAFHLDTNIEFLLGEDLSPKVRVDEVLDEEWHSIIRSAVDSGSNARG